MFHKIIIVGRLGADPEQKYTVDGKAVTSFSVAAENRKDETLWFRVSAWEKLAEVCWRYLKKGAEWLKQPHPARLSSVISSYGTRQLA